MLSRTPRNLHLKANSYFSIVHTPMAIVEIVKRLATIAEYTIEKILPDDESTQANRTHKGWLSMTGSWARGLR